MDPVANMLVVIKNGYMAKKEKVSAPFSKFKFEIAKVLAEKKFVAKVSKNDNRIEIDLIYNNQKPRITQIKRISKLGLRVYTNSKHIKSIKGGQGMTILSTPKGVMANDEAKRKNLGGEVICQVW